MSATDQPVFKLRQFLRSGEDWVVDMQYDGFRQWDGNFGMLVRILDGIYQQIPEQYRTAAEYRIWAASDCYGDDGGCNPYPTFTITYTRRATQEESDIKNLEQLEREKQERWRMRFPQARLR